MRFTTITLAALAALFTTPILADWEIYTGTCSNFGETGYPYPNTLEPVTCDQCGECGRSGNYDGDPENGEPFTSTNPCCADEDCRGDYSLTYIPNNQYHNIYLGDEQIGYCEPQGYHAGDCNPNGVYSCAIGSVRICHSDYCN